MTGQEPFTGISPHTSVAQGAAIHAAILESKYRRGDGELADKVRKHARRGEAGERQFARAGSGRHQSPQRPSTVNHVMIPRNTRLPAEK